MLFVYCIVYLLVACIAGDFHEYVSAGATTTNDDSNSKTYLHDDDDFASATVGIAVADQHDQHQSFYGAKLGLHQHHVEPVIPRTLSLAYSQMNLMKFPQLDKNGNYNLSRYSKPAESPANPRTGIFGGSSGVYDQEEENRDQYLNRKYPDEVLTGLEKGEEELGEDGGIGIGGGSSHPCGGGNCKKGEFLCPLSCSCIPNSWRCDLDADCIQNEDEMDCENIECDDSADQVRCPHTGRCIQRKWLCDGDDDCGDFSDESQCNGKKVNCTYEEFECGNGLCIPISWACDGDNDCRDYTDEQNCSKKMDCSQTEFRCADGTCISLTFKCDLTPDCPDATDEANCYTEQLKCSANEFRCDGYPRCVRHIFRCDGDDDCGDWSDEANCPPAPHTLCLPNEYRCNSGKCILKKFLCDEEKDCEMGEDEGGCLKPLHKTCSSDEFTCSAGNCIKSTWVCDGTKDCALGEDELNCKITCSNETQFACNPVNATPPVIPGTKLKLLPAHSLRSNKACIGISHVCDGKKDCPRGEDERSCPQRVECKKSKSKCHNFCTLLPDGSEGCGCNTGFALSSDGVSCHDVNECAPENEPVCSQICANTLGSYKCSCKNGYTLRPDRRTCKAIGAPPALIFANRVDIRQVTVNNMRYSSVLKGLNNAIAVDYHYTKSYLFWSDLSFDIISRAFLNGTKVTDVVRWGLQNPAGIAIDWVHDLLFWTDSATRRLEVSDLDGLKRYTIVANDMDKPRAIAVHPDKGLVFWTDLGPNPKIECICHNGESRKIIINSSLYWPNGITIDYPVDKLYWVDAKIHMIESSNLDGSNRRQIVTKGLPHPFSLAIFDDAIYWTDWHTKSITTAHKSTGSGFKIIHADLHFPMGIKSYHPQSQPFYKSHCGTNNGGCSYLCLPNSKSYTCVCPLGSELTGDRRTCNPPSKELLLIARKKDLRLSLLQNETSITYDVVVPVDGIKSAEAIAWDSFTDSIFWSDIETSSISQALLNGSNQRTIFRHNLYSISGLDFDWVTKKLYWVNAESPLIETATLSGLRTVLVWKGLDQPKDIAVAPMHGLMFWTDLGNKPRIESAFMDGTNRNVIVKDDIKSPNGLAIDFQDDRLFWVDSGSHSLQSISFFGADRKVIIDRGLPYPFSLVVFGKNVYWTDKNTSSIHIASKENGKYHKILRSSLSNLMDINVFHRERKQVTSKCSGSNGGCSHLCLLAGGLQSYSCACPTGIKLSDDNKTCNSGSKKYLLLAHRSHIRRLSFDVSYAVDVVLPLPPLHNTVSADVDTQTGELFWTDIVTNTITKSDANLRSVSTFIKDGIGTAESLVVDSTGRKLYWTDARLKSVEVSDFNGTTRSVLVWQNLDNPRALVLSYKHGWMFWTNWGKNPKIERADMNGGNRKMLTDYHLKWPNGLTIDPDEDRLYWNDAWYNVIEYSDFDGKNRNTLLKSVQHPYGLAIVDRHLYWTDWKSEALHRVDKKTGEDQQVVSKNLRGLMELRLVEMGKVENNSCGPSNGGCSHLCLRTHGGHSCACPTGILMKDDGKVCQANPTSFLLISSKTTLIRISFDTPGMWAVKLPVSGVFSAMAIDFHYNKSLIFYSDINLKTIRKLGLDGTSSHSDVINTSILMPNGIAVEWLANNIYWTDGEAKTIQVARLDGSHRKTIIKTGIEEPWSVAVYPQKGYLYWTDWGSKPKIEQSLLDGSKRKIIVLNDLGFPKSVTIDYKSKRLYWVDSVRERIETSDLHGNGRVILLADSSIRPFGLTLFENKLYWTDVYNKSTHEADKLTGAHRRVVRANFENIMEIKAIAAQNQPGWSPCTVDNGGCSHLCFYKGYRNGYVCACPDVSDSSCHEEPSHRIEDILPEDESDLPESEISVYKPNYDDPSQSGSNFPPISVLLIIVLVLTAVVAGVLIFTLSSICDGLCRERKRNVFTFINPNYASSSNSDVGGPLNDKKPILWRRFRYEKTQDRVYEVVDDVDKCGLSSDRTMHREIIELPSATMEAPPRPPKPAYLSA